MTIATPLKSKPALVPDDQPINPKTVREAAGLSVPQMAELMGMGLDGYQSWENGLRRPGGPALRLLRLIENDSKAVIKVLQ